MKFPLFFGIIMEAFTIQQFEVYIFNNLTCPRINSLQTIGEDLITRAT